MARRHKRKKAKDLIARYECQGCGHQWGEDLKKLAHMRASGQINPLHSGTGCPCGHPYIKWTNYDELAPLLNRSGQD